MINYTLQELLKLRGLVETRITETGNSPQLLELIIIMDKLDNEISLKTYYKRGN